MTISSRVALAAGLSFVGLAGLVAPTLGQQADRAVQKVATAAGTGSAPAPAAAPAAKPIGPAVIASVDIEAVFKDYEKVKVTSEAFKAEMMLKQSEIGKIANEGKQAAEMIAKFTPGSPDFKKLEERIARLKADLQIKQEQAQNDLVQKEADSLAGLYKDISGMVGRVAASKHLTYVVKISNEPIESTDPNSVMAAMARTVVYADPSTNITPEVIYWLNHYYKASVAAQPGAAAAPAPAAK